MMERLTEKDRYSQDYKIQAKNLNSHCVAKDKKGYVTYYGQHVDKLAEYEDLEEQGLLFRLPCKVGDTVWDNDYGKPCAYTITGFSFGTGENYIDEPVSSKEVVYYYSNSSGSITGSFAVSEIGKTVFLTQAEAEQKLKKMESD